MTMIKERVTQGILEVALVITGALLLFSILSPPSLQGFADPGCATNKCTEITAVYNCELSQGYALETADALPCDKADGACIDGKTFGHTVTIAINTYAVTNVNAAAAPGRCNCPGPPAMGNRTAQRTEVMGSMHGTSQMGQGILVCRLTPPS